MTDTSGADVSAKKSRAKAAATPAPSPTVPSPVDEALAKDAEATSKGRYGILSAAIAIIFGLFFAYDLFEAISNTIGVVAGINHTNQISKDLGLAQTGIPWAILIADLLAAPVVYAIAFLVGRRRGALAKAAIFLVALAATAALSLSIEEGFSRLF